jgi:hypothetical protein
VGEVNVQVDRARIANHDGSDYFALLLEALGGPGLCGNHDSPRGRGDRKNLTRYIIRAVFSRGRKTYLQEESKVFYQSILSLPYIRLRDTRWILV